MSRLARVALALGCLVVGGCQSDKNAYDPPKPLDKMTQEEWCSYYVLYLTNPGITPETRQIATAQMRKRGCPK